MTDDTFQLVAHGGGGESDTADPISDITANSEIVGDSHITAESEHIKARASLKQEILALTREHRDSRKKPPFSAAVMVIMAIICGKHASYTQSQILRVILRTYSYYGEKALNGLLEAWEWNEAYGEDPRLDNFVPKLDDVFQRLDVPIIRHLEVRGVPYHRRDYVAYTVTPTAARIFLASRLCIKRKGTFPFFQLPAELRNDIYEMALRLHPSGVYIGPSFSRLEQHPEQEDSYTGDGSDEDDRLNPLRLANVAALLKVCKQAYAEAAPIFYGLNKFTFASGERLLASHGVGEPSPFRHLRYIGMHLRLFASKANTFERAAQVLVSAKRFKVLAIEMEDQDWFRMPKHRRISDYGRKTTFTNAGQIVGFHDLAKTAAKADVFELRGHCPRIKAFLEAEIEKIKPGKGRKPPQTRMVKPRGKRAK